MSILLFVQMQATKCPAGLIKGLHRTGAQHFWLISSFKHLDIAHGFAASVSRWMSTHCTETKTHSVLTTLYPPSHHFKSSSSHIDGKDIIIIFFYICVPIMLIARPEINQRLGELTNWTHQRLQIAQDNIRIWNVPLSPPIMRTNMYH